MGRISTLLACASWRDGIPPTMSCGATPPAGRCREQAVASTYRPTGRPWAPRFCAEGPPPRPYTVIGVVADTRMKALDSPPAGGIYESAQALTSMQTMMSSSILSGDPGAGLAEIVAVIQRQHPELAASRSQLAFVEDGSANRSGAAGSCRSSSARSCLGARHRRRHPRVDGDAIGATHA